MSRRCGPPGRERSRAEGVPGEKALEGCRQREDATEKGEGCVDEVRWGGGVPASASCCGPEGKVDCEPRSPGSMSPWIGVPTEWHFSGEGTGFYQSLKDPWPLPGRNLPV